MIFGKKKQLVKVTEGAPDAYDIVHAMTNDQVSQYIGLDPVTVPREVQEELYKRFVASCASPLCRVCHGRGHDGWHDSLHQLIPCTCLQTTIRKEVEAENKRDYLLDAHGNKLQFN